MLEYEFGIVQTKEIILEKRYKSIFNPGLARHLIKMGNSVADIKADRNNSEKTIFIFEITNKFNDDLNTLLKNTASK